MTIIYESSGDIEDSSNISKNNLNNYYNILNNNVEQDTNWNEITNDNKLDYTNIKLNLSKWFFFNSHNSGWKFVYEQIKFLHDDNGIIVDDFIEHTFCWGLAPLKNKIFKIDNLNEIAIPYEKARKNSDGKLCFKIEFINIKGNTEIVFSDDKNNILDMTIAIFNKLPLYYKKPTVYKCDWIGFWHFPTDSRTYLSKYCKNEYIRSPDYICKRKAFIESLKHCKLLIVFSVTMKNWVVNKLREIGLDVPVYNMYHPIRFPAENNMFSMEAFNANMNKKIIQVGTWLRNLNLIFNIDNSINYTKLWICRDEDAIIRFANTLENNKGNIIKTIIKSNNLKINTPISLFNNVELINLDNIMYEKTLSENIVVTEIIGASCNNGVIEMIASATPLLVNKVDSVVEYLGEDYPFYYTSYDDLIYKSQNINLIQETHEYLLNLNTRKYITGDYFKEQFLRHMTHSIQTPEEKKIDFVITWVNRDDMRWDEAFNKDNIVNEELPSDSSTINRYASNFNELKYSLRSIQASCGHFLRNIYIVVHDKQTLPEWLNINKNSIYIIRHTDIMEECSYNSFSIEANLHKIKNLSETFVYLNDDIWLLGNWNISDLYHNNMIIFYTSNHVIGKDKDKLNSSFEYAWSNTHTLLDKLFPDTNIDSRYMINHSPYVLNKNTMIKYDNLPEIEMTKKSKFRSINDIGVTCGFQQYVELYTGNAIMKKIKNISLNYKQLIKTKGRIDICNRVMNLQDDFTTNPSIKEIEKVHIILECLFPTKTIFEF